MATEKPRVLSIGLFADSTKPEHLCRAAFEHLRGLALTRFDRVTVNEWRWQMQQADKIVLTTENGQRLFDDAVEAIWLDVEAFIQEKCLPPYCDLIERGGKTCIEPDWDLLDELMQTPPRSDFGPAIADGCHTLGLKGPQWALCKDSPAEGQYTLRQRSARGRGFAWHKVWTAEPAWSRRADE